MVPLVLVQCQRFDCIHMSEKANETTTMDDDPSTPLHDRRRRIEEARLESEELEQEVKRLRLENERLSLQQEIAAQTTNNVPQ